MTHTQTSYRYVAGGKPRAWWRTYIVLVNGSPVKRVTECLTGSNGYATCLLHPLTLSRKGPYFGGLLTKRPTQKKPPKTIRKMVSP